MSEPQIILLGNAQPYLQTPQGRVPHPYIQQATTKVELRNGFDDKDFVDLTLSTDNDRRLWDISRILPKQHMPMAVGINEIADLWPYHSGMSKPAWVAGTHQALVKALAHYFEIPVGEPKMLLVNAGRDAIHAQMMTTGTQPAAFNYMAVTANTAAPAATDTVLTGEIATAGGGLIRAHATYAHTTGTNVSTLTNTFTANGSDSLPVTLAQIGVFNQATSGGTLFVHTALSGTATLSVVGDNLTITESVTNG